MKSFNLQCDQGHTFELMVKSAESLADQQAQASLAPLLRQPGGRTHPALPTVVGQAEGNKMRL